MGFKHESIVTLWTSTGTTLGSVGLVGIIAQGSAADTTLVVKDGTAVRYAPVIGSTQFMGFIFSNQPVAFNNLITTVTGTGSYSVTYYVRP